MTKTSTLPPPPLGPEGRAAPLPGKKHRLLERARMPDFVLERQLGPHAVLFFCTAAVPACSTSLSSDNHIYRSPRRSARLNSGGDRIARRSSSSGLKRRVDANSLATHFRVSFRGSEAPKVCWTFELRPVGSPPAGFRRRGFLGRP